MNLHELDLNLVPALRALLDERHVTRASQRLGVSQSAMSRALGRLREHFKDELLIKTQTGMVYTPLALALLPEVTSLCQALERTFIRELADFEPSTAQLPLKLGMSELGQALWAPALLAHMRAHAPGISLSLGAPGHDDDLTLETTAEPAQAILSAPYVALGAPALIAQAKGLEAIAQLAHGELADEPTPSSHAVDVALAQLGLRRHITLRASSLLALMMGALGADLILMLPSPVATSLRTRFGDGLTSAMPPQEPIAQDEQWSRWPQWHIKLTTHPRQDARLEQATQWLTQALKAIIHGDPA